jgi:hypothetical protein
MEKYTAHKTLTLQLGVSVVLVLIYLGLKSSTWHLQKVHLLLTRGNSKFMHKLDADKLYTRKAEYL